MYFDYLFVFAYLIPSTLLMIDKIPLQFF